MNLSDAVKQAVAQSATSVTTPVATPTSLTEAVQQAGGTSLSQEPTSLSEAVQQANSIGDNGSILPTKTEVTQTVGTENPIEPTAGHQALDTNFAADPNTPVKVPNGQWMVVSAYNQAPAQGAPGEYQYDTGWGNNVILENTQTGEKLQFSHLANVNVQPGGFVPGGTVVGATGSSGNATGPNLGVTYFTKDGNIGDIMKSQYANGFQI